MQTKDVQNVLDNNLIYKNQMNNDEMNKNNNNNHLEQVNENKNIDKIKAINQVNNKNMEKLNSDYNNKTIQINNFLNGNIIDNRNNNKGNNSNENQMNINHKNNMNHMNNMNQMYNKNQINNVNQINNNMNMMNNKMNNMNQINNQINNNHQVNNNNMNQINNQINNNNMNRMNNQMNDLKHMNQINMINNNKMNNMYPKNNMNMNQMMNMNMNNIIFMNQMMNMNKMNNLNQMNFVNFNQNQNNFFIGNFNNQNNINQMNNNAKLDENTLNLIYGNKNDVISLFKNLDQGFLFPIVGLKNVGLTCYMNSTLQCLLHIPELNNFFINIYPNNKEIFKYLNKDAETKGELSMVYHQLVKDVKEKDKEAKGPKKKYFFFNYDYSVSPKKFNTTLSRLNPQFAQFESNDSKDLLLYLFQSMHEELNYYGQKKVKKVPKCDQTKEADSYNFFVQVNMNLNLSIFSYLFYGILKSFTVCSNCHSVLYNFQYFQFLSLPLYSFHNKKFNIYKGLKEFIQKEKMTGDNRCYCQRCKDLYDAEVSSIIYQTPPYLIINFDYGKDKKYRPSSIDFGQIIDLTDFTDPNCKRKTYELVAVSTHIGRSGDSGHYISYCKDQNDLWYLFNDSSHSNCDFEEAKKHSPYLLIFKRIENQKHNK